MNLRPTIKHRTYWPILILTVSGGSLCVDEAEGAFTNITQTAGIFHRHYAEDFEITDEVQILSAGAAAGDFDGDGWVDLFVTRLDGSDLLYRNLGATRNGVGPWFENVAQAAGITAVDKTNGAAWGDIDNDGDLDLYVSVIEAPRYYLYVNQGNGTFVEEAVIRGADLTSELEHHGYSVAFGDYDRDGWLDIHTCEWFIDRSNPLSDQHSVLLRNLGSNAPGFFENVTKTAGVEVGNSELQYAFASGFSDMDGDGWPDLLVTGDIGTSSLFWNNGDGTFTDGTAAAGVNKGKNEMGSAIADYNADGLLDWFVTSTEFDNRMYRNLGNRTFSEEAENLGIENGDWGWGTEFFDYDNDGDHDIIMTNGWHLWQDPSTPKENYATPLYFWRNDNGVFTPINKNQSGLSDTGEGKGLLSFDFDRDGDLDIFVANNGDEPVLYRNDEVNTNAWLRLKLRGKKSNTQGIGARIWVTPEAGEDRRLFELTGGGRFLGQSEAVVHIGLGGQSTAVEQVDISWPSGKQQTLTQIPINQTLVVEESFFNYPSWLEQYFNLEERKKIELVDPGKDPDKDGFNNLWEFAFGLNPREFDGESPIHFEKQPGAENRYSLSFPRIKESDDLAFFFESSTDLKNWGPPEDYTESVVVGETKDLVRLDITGEEPFFLRIRIESLH